MPATPSEPPPSPPCRTVRCAALITGTSLQTLAWRRAEGTSRPASVAMGLLAVGAWVAIAHVAGTDPRALLAGGQSRLLPDLLGSVLSKGAGPPNA
jgi:hypothetical protein